MPFIVSLIITALLGVGSAIQKPSKPNQPPSFIPITSSVCLDDTIAQDGFDPGLDHIPRMLSNIKKPTRANVSAGYEIPICQNNGNCAGPDTSDYILVAKHVRSDYTVFPNNFEENLKISDRQLVKQIDFTPDPVISDRYKNRLYRSFCGDWCSTCDPADVICKDAECLTGECKTDKPPVTLPFRGTYHCDFLFYLEDSDDKGNTQLDENGNLMPDRTNEKLPELPSDKSYFSIYMRKGAAIPDSLKCQKPVNINVKGDSIAPTQTENSLSAQSLSENSLQFPANSENYYQLTKNPASSDGSYTSRNTQIKEFQKLGEISDPFSLKGQYEVYRNLLDPQNPDLLYLVSPGLISGARNGLKSTPLYITRFNYFLLQNMFLKSGSQKSLKLGTFIPSSDWIKKWAQESKPAIYLYPQVPTEVTVKLDPSGYLTVSDPPYDPEKGWQIIAFPDGTIQSRLGGIHDAVDAHSSQTASGQPTISYPYLYYEAAIDKIPVVKSGAVIAKKDLSNYLTKTIAILGLNPKESADYLEYWMPRLTNQPENYFLVYFLNQEQIETIEPIDINMQINTSIRIRTYFKPLQKPIDISPQIFDTPPIRTGNILVEWGGILDTP